MRSVESESFSKDSKIVCFWDDFSNCRLTPHSKRIWREAPEKMPWPSLNAGINRIKWSIAGGWILNDNS